MAFPNPSSEADQLETNLAYYLQNCEPGDPQALSLLIENYGAELIRLSYALQDANWKTRPALGRVIDLTVNTLAKAVRDLNQFWGETNVRAWLFRIMVSLYRRKQKQIVDKESQLLAALPGLDDNPARDYEEAALWSQVDSLPERQRLPLILRGLLGLSVPEIARISSNRTEAVRKNLGNARRSLNPELYESSTDNQNLVEAHPDYQRLAHAKLDGLLDARIEDDYRLRDHLRSCRACREFVEEIETWQTLCGESLGYRWPRMQLGRRARELLVQEVQHSEIAPNYSLRFPLPLRQLGYLVVIVGVVAALFWSANQYLPEEPANFRPPTERPAPTEMPFPTPIGTTPSRPFERGFGNREPDIRVDFNFQPSISGNGRWIAYASVKSGYFEDEPENYPGVFLYDQQEDTREQISVTSEGEVTNGFSYSPSISDDGQRVVFASDASNISSSARGCRANMSFECLDIYLRDRSEGTTERISLTDTGDAPDGPSFSPLISADGGVVFFWSLATNLISGEGPDCEQEKPELVCADLYAYDTESRTAQRLPIGRMINENIFITNQEFSISGDGRYIALTIEATDQIARQLDMPNKRDVYVFDIENETLELVNLSSSGQPGDGPSDQPAISADGHFVTFASSAGNLVANDSNDSRDIFVRDLGTGITELVSVDSAGEQSGQGIGDQTETMEGLASQKIGISEDGRFIVFSAQSSELSPQSIGLCESTEGFECLVLFIHDRLTGNTRHIDPQENRRLHMNLLPDISSDGRWITFMEMVECLEFDVCFDVGFFDRELNTLRNLSRRFITRNRETPEDNSPPRIAQGTVWTNNRRVFSQFQGINNITFSDDGNLIATGSQDGSVQVWDSSDLDLVYSKLSHQKSVTEVDFSPDSELLATASMDGYLKVWDIEEERLVYSLLGDSYQVFSLSFSPDGQWLAGGTSRGLVVWEFEGNELIQRAVLRQPGKIRGLAFSPDSAQIALAADDNSVWLIELKPFEITHRLGGQDLDPLSVAFSPDGDYLAVGTMDGSLNLWEVTGSAGDEERSPSLVNTFWHTDWVQELTFSPDGEILAILSNDFNIRLWSVPDGELLAQDRLSSERLLSLAFSPNGRTLAVSTDQGAIVLWQDNSAVEEPRLFSRLDADSLTIPPDYYPNYYPLPVELIKQDAAIDPVNRWSVAFNQTIYEAMESIGLDLKAPAELPAGTRFKGAKTEVEQYFGLAIFYYEYAPDGAPLGTMFLVQGPAQDIFPTVSIGATARVERVSINNGQGEYVSGDWQTTQDENPAGIDDPAHWHWNADTPVKRLQWLEGNLGFSLTFIGHPEDSSRDEELLSRDDLLDIAGKLSSIAEPETSTPVLATYQVKNGDTCTSIAQQFNAQVRDLISLNELTDNCELIYAGQEIEVPLTAVQEPVFTMDLDCNGAEERVMIVIDPNARTEDSIYGFSVQSLEGTGLYADQWSYRISDVDTERLSRPRTFSIDGCQRGLRLEATNPLDGGSAQLVFRWDGEKMVQLEDRP